MNIIGESNQWEALSVPPTPKTWENAENPNPIFLPTGRDEIDWLAGMFDHSLSVKIIPTTQQKAGRTYTYATPEITATESMYPTRVLALQRYGGKVSTRQIGSD